MHNNCSQLLKMLKFNFFIFSSLSFVHCKLQFVHLFFPKWKKKLGSALQNRVGRRPETNACFFFGLTHGFIDDDILFLAIYKKIAGKLPRLDYRNVTRRGNRREGEDGTQTGKGLTAVRCGLSAYTLHIRKQKNVPFEFTESQTVEFAVPRTGNRPNRGQEIGQISDRKGQISDRKGHFSDKRPKNQDLGHSRTRV